MNNELFDTACHQAALHAAEAIRFATLSDTDRAHSKEHLIGARREAALAHKGCP